MGTEFWSRSCPQQPNLTNHSDVYDNFSHCPHCGYRNPTPPTDGSLKDVSKLAHRTIKTIVKEAPLVDLISSSPEESPVKELPSRTTSTVQTAFVNRESVLAEKKGILYSSSRTKKKLSNPLLMYQIEIRVYCRTIDPADSDNEISELPKPKAVCEYFFYRTSMKFNSDSVSFSF
jgi:hypothetical protein